MELTAIHGFKKIYSSNKTTNILRIKRAVFACELNTIAGLIYHRDLLGNVEGENG